jgi:hypothetical protein
VTAASSAGPPWTLVLVSGIVPAGILQAIVVLPNFLIIGAAKSGTTSLYEQLRGHPDVFMPPRRWKEPTFFSAEAEGRWSRGLDWYESLFRGHHGQRAVGEASTSYTKAPIYGDAAEKIAATLPGARLIYLVREPVAQMASHYRHMVMHDGLRSTFHEAAEDDDFLFDCACYAMQLDRYLQHLPMERIRVVPFERYAADPEGTARELCRFLEIDDRQALPLDRPRNVGVGRRPVLRGRPSRWIGGIRRRLPSAASRAFEQVLTRPISMPVPEDPVWLRLRDRMATEIDALERMTGLDLHHWRAGG